MAELMTAKSYRHGTIVREFEKGGKPYATVKLKCERCVNGVFPAGVENGQIKPHPNANGVCFACGGLGYTTKDVRLYTEQELARMETANEKAKVKRQAEQEQKMKAEFEVKRKEWLAKNNFSEDGYTYIITGDSFSIKDELKASGWRYDPVIKWHKADPAGYENRVIKIHVEDAFEGSAWGDYHYLSGAKDKINELLAGTQPQETSEWLGEVGDKLIDVKVQLVRKYSFETKYGFTTAYNFKDENGNKIVWFTSTFQPFDQNQWLKIKTATIKKLDEYKGVHQTVVTRAKLIELNPA